MFQQDIHCVRSIFSSIYVFTIQLKIKEHGQGDSYANFDSLGIKATSSNCYCFNKLFNELDLYKRFDEQVYVF